MRTLVTGGCGFIGSHLVEALLADGHDVIVVDDLSVGRRANLESVQGHPRLHVYIMSADDPTLAEIFCDDIDWVFHLAARADIVPSINRPVDYHNANVNGTLTVLECARRAKVKRFIYVASSSCYGIPDRYPTPETAELRPMYPYALTKLIGEQYALHWAQVYKLPVLSLRLFNVYGPRARTNGTYGAVFGVFLSQLANQAPFTIVGDGKQTRDFTYVSDVVEALISAAKSNQSGFAMNVGSGGTYSINSLVNLLRPDNPEYTYLPERPGEPARTYADTSLIEKTLGWKAKVSFAQGVRIMRDEVENFRDAPLWTPAKIKEATADWFLYLGKKEEAPRGY